MLRMMILPTALLTLTNCTPVGDFCEVWQGNKVFAKETARQMVRTNRAEVEGIAVENAYGNEHCD